MTELLDASDFAATCDIVDQLLAQSPGPEIAGRERRVHAYLSASDVLLAVFDGRAHTPRLASRGWRRVFGERLLATSMIQVFDQVFRTGALARVHEAMVYAAGDAELQRWFTGAVAPVRTAIGELRGVMLICSDITDDVLARRLGLDSHAPMWGGTLDTIDYRNGSLCTLVGDRTPFIHLDDARDHAHALDQVLEGESSADLRLWRGEDDWRWHHVHYIADRDRWIAHATPLDRSASSFDRSRVALAESRRVNLQKDQFIASLSHELRGPITTLLLWEKVLRDTPDPQLQVRALDAIHQSVVSQSSLVADLLDVSRAISGKLHIEFQPVSVADVLTAALDQVAPLALAKQLRVESEIGEVGMVAGDALRLQQIFNNLLANAVRLTDLGGWIRLVAQRERGAIVVAVSDSGRGISGDQLPNVFDAFRQHVDASRDDGLGLGLAIARQLAIAHGGTLVATSAGAGKGSCFTFALASTHASPQPAAPRPTPTLGGVHLLLVDDDPRVLDALQILLERAGAVVDTAASAIAGRDAIARHRPDVVLSDLAMPDEDGFSFVRALRHTDSAMSTVPAVAITARVTPADRQKALAAGFDRYVTKPVNVDQLIAMIAGLVVGKPSISPG